MKTKDMFLAGFLDCKGYKVVDWEEIKPYKLEFDFNVPIEKEKILKIEFNDSAIAKNKASQIKLKDLAY